MTSPESNVPDRSKGKVLEYFSRKFILAITAMGSGFYLITAGFGNDIAAYTGLVAAVLGFYNGANVAQDWIALRSAGNKPSSSHSEGEKD